MSIIDKISRKSVQDSRLFQEEKLRIPSEFTRFERSLPLKIKMRIISKKLRRAFSIFDFFIDFETIDIECNKAKSKLYNSYLEIIGDRTTNAIATKSELLSIQNEIARINEELEIRYKKLNFMNTVYRKAPPEDINEMEPEETEYYTEDTEDVET